jgi:hypothetical protein
MQKQKIRYRKKGALKAFVSTTLTSKAFLLPALLGAVAAAGAAGVLEAGAGDAAAGIVATTGVVVTDPVVLDVVVVVAAVASAPPRPSICKRRSRSATASCAVFFLTSEAGSGVGRIGASSCSSSVLFVGLESIMSSCFCHPMILLLLFVDGHFLSCGRYFMVEE